MRKHLVLLMIIGIFGLILQGCQSLSFLSQDVSVQKSVQKIDTFSSITSDFSYFDYSAMANALDEVIFSFASNMDPVNPSYILDDEDSWSPVGFWIDQPRQPSGYDPLTTGYLRRSFGLPTYVGDTRVVSSGSETLTMLSMVLGSSYAGIDKSAQDFGYGPIDFVEMTLSGYDTGSQLVHNGGIQGQSFWYDIFPQILFARLYDLYPSTEFMREMVLNGADQWLEALPYFLDDLGNPDYEFVGYNVLLESPTVSGDHIEPPNGGLSFLFYAAYVMTEEEKYLEGAKTVLDYLESYQRNPNYEALTDYAPFVAAALNYRYGTHYDVGKFIDFLFDTDSAFRPGWSVMQGSFAGYSVDGLVGQSGDYAFSMNSFHLASVLAPMVKYDARYSDAIGKYMLSLVNNASVFFPHEVPLDHQTMNTYLNFDLSGSICYEGFRNIYASINGLAMGDATTMFSQPSDLSVYSSAFIGFLAGIVAQTDVNGILRIDLNKTDSFGMNDYPYYLIFNPYDYEQVVTYETDNSAYDLYDITTKTLLARNVSGDVSISIPAESSRVVVELPQNSTLERVGNDILFDGAVIAKYYASVEFTNLVTRQELTDQYPISIATSVSTGDQVVSMEIYFGDILAYQGVPLESFQYDKSLLPDTDYTLRVVITTQNGFTDFTTKRVVCR